MIPECHTVKICKRKSKQQPKLPGASISAGTKQKKETKKPNKKKISISA